MYTFPQCADVEASDVILIKDEDDIRGCGATEGETVKCGNMARHVAFFLLIISVCCAMPMMLCRTKNSEVAGVFFTLKTSSFS